MTYQLVIQFSEELLTYDELIRLEDKLIDALEGKAEVDGHDLGAGEANIFILTGTPVDTFHDARMVIEGKVSKEHYRSAYREVEGDSYTILWPPNLSEFKIA
jgi:hypothetical protein